MIAAVILAAGSSKRLGRPKQLVTVGGETLIHRAVTTAIEAALQPLIVVVGNTDLVQPLQTIGALVLFNPNHKDGIATSIRIGVLYANSAKASGVILMTCDQPALTAQHLRNLIAQPDAIAGSGYANKIGIPAYFPATEFTRLMDLQGDTGARSLLVNARSVRAEALALDIDTEDDLKRARQLYG